MSGSQKSGIDLLRTALVALSSIEVDTPDEIQARAEISNRAARARAAWAKEVAARSRSSRSKKTSPAATGKPRGVAGAEAKRDRSPKSQAMKNILNVDLPNWLRQPKRGTITSFARRKASEHGLNARHVAAKIRQRMKGSVQTHAS